MQYSSLMLAALSGFTIASPIVERTNKDKAPSYYKLHQVARFDNAEGIPVTGGGAVGTNGIYDDLLYKGFGSYTENVTPLAGLKANSPQTLILYSGQAPQTILQGQPAMTVNYPDSTIDHFDISSFYWGCVLGLENALDAVPTACTLTVTGVDKDGKTVNKKSFHFDPQGALAADQVLAKLEGFTGLYALYFQTTADNPLLQIDVATGVDTITYDVYSANPISP